MKAHEYVKLVGWEYAKLNASSCSHQYYFLHNGYAEVCVSELRVLVESYELVQEYGADKIKQKIRFLESIHLLTQANQLKQAILDVESCNE